VIASRAKQDSGGAVIISVINHTDQLLDEEIQAAVRAVNRQINDDFEPYWSLAARLRLEGRSPGSPNKSQPPDMRGDAVLYLWDKADVKDAIGYHEKTNSGIPYGFVFTEVSRELGEPWTVTFSHEVLEMIGDPEVNLLVMGPHPNPKQKRDVFHWFEMCDAVQAETYVLDGVAVSNFVLPLYFTGGDEKGGRNDFLAMAKGGQTLRSFGVNAGGYVGFYDPVADDHVTYELADDEIATRRRRIKLALKQGRRACRYQRFKTQRRRR
jgi:hypothetical protein